jgi:phosphatidylserine decarboxylase
LSKQYEGGSLAVFRLAPQDYHRYCLHWLLQFSFLSNIGE